jgi:hypothetical protein
MNKWREDEYEILHQVGVGIYQIAVYALLGTDCTKIDRGYQLIILSNPGLNKGEAASLDEPLRPVRLMTNSRCNQ